MFSQDFQVNPAIKAKIERVGQCQTPVLLVDDFAADCNCLKEQAGRCSEFGADSSSKYPGLRAPLPRDYVIATVRALLPSLYQVFGVPANLRPRPVNTVFSLICTDEADLEPGQCVPHFDSPGPYYLAILHYLNTGPYCPTGLFRHRPTGLERITEQNLPGYLESRRQQETTFRKAESGYITGSTGEFELYHQIDYVPNRLVVYPGGLLHSGLVNPEVDIDPNPQSGRLTANIFIDFLAPQPAQAHG